MVPDSSVTFGSVALKSYKLGTGVVKVSSELLEDSAFNLEAYLAEKFGERFGRGAENFLTNGSGSGQPTGIITALANAGVVPVIAVGSNANDGSGSTGTNSVGYQDLINLETSVDPAYRDFASTRYMLHDATLQFFKGLLDKYGRPLWAPGIAVNAPDTLNGYQYVLNQHMPVIGASHTPIIFGDLGKFCVRKVAGVRVQRLVELYANNDQVGFQAFRRFDSNYIFSGGRAIGILQNHS